MSIYEKITLQLRRKVVRGIIVVVILALAAIIIFDKNTDNSATEDGAQLPLVQVTTASEYLGGESISLVGSVRSFTEAAVTSEVSGRVVSVGVSLGEEIPVGQILVTLENASERAAVLQAEGVYDAALAAAAQTTVGTNEAQSSLLNAKNNAVSAFKASFNTNNGAIVNTIDQFFSAPNTAYPGLKIDGRGFTTEINAERVELRGVLATWQTKLNTTGVDSDLVTELEYASGVTQKVVQLVDTFITVFNQQTNSDRYTDAELQTFSTNFTTLRGALISTQSSIDAALNGLSSAEDYLRRAELSAAGSLYSSSDAQVKQALGALRGAQANLAKTIIRTPISGTVNSLSVRTGDYLQSFSPVAEVANNNALEIVTYIGDSERELLSVGDQVLIEGLYNGIVTEIAPAVDASTRKTEVRIAAESSALQNGDTVTVYKEIDSVDTSVVLIPLSAVKFELEDGLVFVVENDALVEKPVELGVVRGGSVQVLSGLDATEQFVVDVRGLQSGTKVEVNN